MSSTRGRRVGVTLVAALGVVGLGACGGGDGADGDSAERGNLPIQGAPTIDVVGDNFRFDPERLSVAAGELNVAFTSEDIFHTFVIDRAGGEEVVAAAERGETDRGGVSLDPGEYVFYCDVPGHRAAGMEGILVVT